MTETTAPRPTPPVLDISDDKTTLTMTVEGVSLVMDRVQALRLGGELLNMGRWLLPLVPLDRKVGAEAWNVEEIVVGIDQSAQGDAVASVWLPFMQFQGPMRSPAIAALKRQLNDPAESKTLN